MYKISALIENFLDKIKTGFIDNLENSIINNFIEINILRRSFRRNFFLRSWNNFWWKFCTHDVFLGFIIDFVKEVIIKMK